MEYSTPVRQFGSFALLFYIPFLGMFAAGICSAAYSSWILKTTERMHNPNQPEKHLAAIADAEWMLIHSDTFITNRDRILLADKAFKIDRDLSSVCPHLPNSPAPTTHTTPNNGPNNL